MGGEGSGINPSVVLSFMSNFFVLNYTLNQNLDYSYQYWAVEASLVVQGLIRTMSLYIINNPHFVAHW